MRAFEYFHLRKFSKPACALLRAHRLNVALPAGTTRPYALARHLSQTCKSTILKNRLTMTLLEHMVAAETFWGHRTHLEFFSKAFPFDVKDQNYR